MGLARLYKRGGLTHQQWSMLCECARKEQLVYPTNLQVRTLIKRGLVETAPSTVQPYVVVVITPAGRKLVDNGVGQKA